MVEINKRLKAIHQVFCKERCKFRRGKKCTDTLKKAGLANCPVGEWWDLNDWVNHVDIVLGKIKRQYDKSHTISKNDAADILTKQ